MHIFLPIQAKNAHAGSGLRRLAAFCTLLPLAACSADPPAAASGCDGSLQVEIHGGIAAAIDWQAGLLECSGMPRPDGAGARLRFSGTVAESSTPQHLLFILAMPELARGETPSETPTTITLIEEDAARFFSSGENAICWSDIDEQSLLSAPDEYSISGIAYCVSPLAEVNGTASVSFADLSFSGRLSWADPE